MRFWRDICKKINVFCFECHYITPSLLGSQQNESSFYIHKNLKFYKLYLYFCEENPQGAAACPGRIVRVFRTPTALNALSAKTTLSKVQEASSRSHQPGDPRTNERLSIYKIARGQMQVVDQIDRRIFPLQIAERAAARGGSAG